MPTYGDELSLRQARQLYFDANGFGDGGYEARWVKLQAGPLRLYFPNTKARVRAVRLHDLHHTATQYPTTWTGEAEIAAWEIASGCGRHYVAWLLNLQAWAIGLALAPGAVFRAFVRGRASTNLYRGTFDERQWLEESLGTLRHCLGLDRPPPPPAPLDRLLFTLWSAAAVVVLAASAAPWIAVPALLVSLLS